MVWACTYSIQAESVRKAGAYANATAIGAAYTLAWGEQAEGLINTLTNKNWSSLYAGLHTDSNYTSGILVDCASSLVAIYILNYDMTGYPARTAETMLDVLYTAFWRDIKILQSMQGAAFVQGP